MNALLKQRSEFQLHRTRQRYYFHGTRHSHLLIYPPLNLKSLLFYLIPLKSIQYFAAFYTDLYSSEIEHDKKKCEEFLKYVNLPHLSNIDSDAIDAQISLVELKEAVQEMQRAPVLDGLPLEFFLMFWPFTVEHDTVFH